MKLFSEDQIKKMSYTETKQHLEKLLKQPFINQSIIENNLLIQDCDVWANQILDLEDHMRYRQQLLALEQANKQR